MRDHTQKTFLTVRLALLAAVFLPLAISASATPALAEGMQIETKAERKAGPGPEANFTGRVVVSPLAPASHHTETSVVHVAFSVGARSAWHTHPAGQTLIVTEGTGWVQEEGGKKIEIKPGDVIWTPPGVKHWHGATASSAMTHVALTENVDGRNVDWMEKVSDEQYRD